MRILVCFKVMPNPDKILEQDWEIFEPDIDISYAGMEFNCFDQSALELGLRMKESMVVQGQEVTCTAITIGKSLHDSVAQKLYSVGFDEVVNIENNQPEFATNEIANTITEYAQNNKFDLILMGSTGGMAETGMVPFLVAEKLSYPIVSDIESASFEDNKILAMYQRQDGLWQKTAKMPLVMTVGNSPMVLRCSTLRARLSFKGNSAKHIPAIENNKENKKAPQLSRPKGGRNCKMLCGEPQMQVDEVLKLLTCDESVKHESKQNKDFLHKLPESSVYYELSNEISGRLDINFSKLVKNLQDRKPELAILPDTEDGRQLAVQLASHFGCSCFTKVTIIKSSSKSITLQNRVCASNLIWTQKIEFPAIITTSQTIETITKVPVKIQNTSFDSWLFDQKLLMPVSKSELDSSKIVLACGSGIGSKEECQKVRNIATKLGAGFGLTRPSALNSWGSTNEIIGQSGKLIAPSVCLALGASGAGAFLVGIEQADKIIAVNTDTNALIFKHADIGLKMDATKFVDMMLQAFENRGI